MIIKTDKDIIKCYFEDESGLKGGYADEVLLPENEKDISEIFSIYSGKKTPITISGGGTGVTGARVPFGGSILATDSLNKIIDIDIQNFTATLQPGVRLSDFQGELSKNNLCYLPDPTEPYAFIGGTISTNACGARGFKYGPTRNYIKRLKIILTTGDILEIKRGEYFLNKNRLFSISSGSKEIKIKIPSYSIPNIKTSAGYHIKDHMDLIDLFIGQEGTLGFISEIDVSIAKKEDEIISFFAFFPSDINAMNFIQESKRSMSPLSLEYMDINSLCLLRKKYTNITEKSRALVYFEQDCSRDKETSITDTWMSLLEKHNSLMDESYFADSEREREKLKEFRHSLPEMVNEIVKKNGFSKVGTDIAVPEHNFPEMFSYYKEKLKETDIGHLIFGHIGENHMHVNMLPKTEEEYIKSRKIYMDFVKKAVSLGGTVSAEHGIGKLKHTFLEAMYGRDILLQMAMLKKSLDPACILGIDNIFPKELL